MVGWRCNSFVLVAPMPHKHNADRRHHTLLRVLSRPKMSFTVQNWPAYEAGLRRRDSLTLWLEDDALDRWQSRGQGGQAQYTDAAIQTSLMVRTGTWALRFLINVKQRGGQFRPAPDPGWQRLN
jgi:hypothetical protein